MTVQRIETEFAGRALTLETGRLAKQAAGSALVRFGDTMVLAAVTVSPNISSLPFFPLTVEYREKTYAAGKIPGGFIKREGPPVGQRNPGLPASSTARSGRCSRKASRTKSRSFVYVLSADQENDADVLALLATSTALAASQVPWNGPIAGVRVGRVRGQVGPQPDLPAARVLDIDMWSAGSADSIIWSRVARWKMTEAGTCSRRSRSRRRASGNWSRCRKKLLAKAGASRR